MTGEPAKRLQNQHVFRQNFPIFCGGWEAKLLLGLDERKITRGILYQFHEVQYKSPVVVRTICWIVVPDASRGVDHNAQVSELTFYLYRQHKRPSHALSATKKQWERKSKRKALWKCSTKAKSSQLRKREGRKGNRKRKFLLQSTRGQAE